MGRVMEKFESWRFLQVLLIVAWFVVSFKVDMNIQMDTFFLNFFIILAYIINEERRKNEENKISGGWIAFLMIYIVTLLLLSIVGTYVKKVLIIRIAYMFSLAWPLIDGLRDLFVKDENNEVTHTHQKRLRKKSVFKPWIAVATIAFLVMSCLDIYGVFEWVKTLRKWKYESLNITTMLSLQATISFLAITLMNIVLPEKDKVVMGLSYKAIFFNSCVYKYFNIPNCVLYLVLMLAFNIVTAVFSCFEGPYKNLSKVCFVFVLLCSLCVVIYTIHLSLVAKYKNSRIYYMIEHNIKNGDRELYAEIVVGLLMHPINRKIKNTALGQNNCGYYADECKILISMLRISDENHVEQVNEKIRRRLLDYDIQSDHCRFSKRDMDEFLKSQICLRREIVRGNMKQKLKTYDKLFYPKIK